MNYLNYEFFEEFKSLDNLCRDIYGDSVDNKLGVTLYLEDMDSEAYRGSFKVSGWGADYDRLKTARNIRNELAHSRDSFSADICSQEDIDFLRSFKARILNQTDPLALLEKQIKQSHPVVTSPPDPQPKPEQPPQLQQKNIIKTPSSRRQSHSDHSQDYSPLGCFGLITLFGIFFALTILFFKIFGTTT